MNETFEKIDFSHRRENSEKFSFYEFTKNPPLNNERINFFEKFHISFNINNLILNNKIDEHEMEAEVIANNENVEENYMHNNTNNISITNKSEIITYNHDALNEETRNNLTSIEHNSNNKSNFMIENDENYDNKNNLDIYRKRRVTECNVSNPEYSKTYNNIGHDIEIKYNTNTNHEEFNDMEDFRYDFYSDCQLANDFCSKNNPKNDLKLDKSSYDGINHQKSLDSSYSINNNMNNLSDKFNLFAFKPKNRSVNEDSYKNNTNDNNSCNLPFSSDKKLITKEYFSKQINSIGNLHSEVQLSEIKELESKYGMTLDAYGCPDYNSYSEEKLKEEMKKYGLKPASVKFMVKTLTQIWEFINMKKLPENFKTELSKFLNVNKPQLNLNEDVNNSNSLFNEYSSIGKSSIRHLNDVKKESIINAIQEDQELWIKILRFKKIELKEIKEVLNKKGIIVENELLKAFMTEMGVVIYQAR